MKLLLDVCVSSRSLTAHLVAQGHDVLSAISIDPGATDERLLEFAQSESRILITEDKDFGELIFAMHQAHGPIVRIVELSIDERIQALDELFDRYGAELVGRVVVTVSPGRIRIRRREE